MQGRCEAVRRSPGRFLFAGIAVLIGLLSAAPADATIREWLMQRAGLDPAVLKSAPSVRLAGMGDVGLCVMDESNEINVRDFGRNVAGVLDDSDRWAVESWFGSTRQQAETAASSSERTFGQAGVQAIRHDEWRALGADVNWTFYEEKINPGDWARVRGPLTSALVNQRIGPVTLGLIVGRETENEDRISPDYFSLGHRQDRWVGQLGARFLHAGWRFAAGWGFERGEVKGTSIDYSRFHHDEFTWVRPVDRFSCAVIFPFGPQSEGGIRGHFMSRTGGETAIRSESAESRQNASGGDILLTDIVTFHEEETDSEVSTLWRIHLGEGTTLGIAGRYAAWEWDVTEGLNFKGSNRTGRWENNQVSAGIGLSHTLLNGRLRTALQARGAQGDVTSEDKLGLFEATARSAMATLGAEAFLSEEVVLRASLMAGGRDLDIDAPLTLVRMTGISGGISWLPMGGGVQVHAALSHRREEPDHEEAIELEDQRNTSYALGLRLLL